MAYFLKGIGDTATKANEILPSLDARINKFIVGHESGVIAGDYGEFDARKIDRGIIVKGGMAEAHGFFGVSDTEVQFNFVLPAVTNYLHVYAEMDLTVVPNKFELKVTPMSNTADYTFQHDDLTKANGRYQIPLWLVTLTPITLTLSDERSIITTVKAANFSETAEILPQSDDSNRVATTSYVRQAISDAFNITEADITTSAGEVIGKVRRQGNFVICSGSGLSKGTGITATLSQEFRPKETVTIGVSCSFMGMAQMPNNPISGGTSGTVSADGTLKINVNNASGSNMTVNIMTAMFYGGWEVTK